MRKRTSLITCTLHTTMLLLTLGLEASSLKIYNMHDLPIRGFTSPIADCGHGREDCVVFPYQSIINSHSVTFTLIDEGIQVFMWEGRIGPRYSAIVNLEKNEYATLEILGEGYYKFKGKKLYAEQI